MRSGAKSKSRAAIIFIVVAILPLESDGDRNADPKASDAFLFFYLVRTCGTLSGYCVFYVHIFLTCGHMCRDCNVQLASLLPPPGEDRANTGSFKLKT